MICMHLYRKKGFFVDLYVRESNAIAVQMYKKLGYVVYRRVLSYYSADQLSPEEDAFDMRKSLSNDPKKLCMVPCSKPVTADQVT